MSDSAIKAPTWFLVVAGIALLWNLMGVMAYIGQVTMTPEAMAALPAEQQALYASTPAWATAAFALAVFGGALGCMALLLRKTWAAPLLIISLAAIVVQMFYAFFISNSFEVFGPGGMIMPIMVILIAVYLVVLARQAKEKSWLT